MNNRMIISIIVIVVVIAAGIFLLSKNNASQMHMQPATPTQMQTQGQSQTSPTSGPTVATKNAVTIQNFAFSPATLTVKVGDTVTWTNQDSAGHSATADDNSFDRYYSAGTIRK